MYSILVCDDDRDIAAALKIYLTAEGHNVIEAHNGRQVMELLKVNEVQLVLMDIMMPEMDGISTLIKLREELNIPVILLTAKSEDSDKILGLNIGADDYITKPFNPVEVIARVKAQLRRYTRLGSSSSTGSAVIKCGMLELNDENKTVLMNGDEINLTPTEYDILKLLMKNQGKVFSIKEIYNKVWNDITAYGAENTVAVHIRHLREKVELNPSEPRYLKVVWGQGYKIERSEKL